MEGGGQVVCLGRLMERRESVMIACSCPPSYLPPDLAMLPKENTRRTVPAGVPFLPRKLDLSAPRRCRGGDKDLKT